MAQERHLPNAPIREALVDIAVKLPDDVDVEVLQGLADQISADYPQVNKFMEAEFQFRSKDLSTTPVAHRPVGVRCSNTVGNRIVQFRLNGFTYNWLRPYSNWPELRAVSETHWRMYSDRVRPLVITRLALRYINDITLPLPFGDFAEYLTADPKIPSELPQTLSHFLTRVGLSDQAAGMGAVVTQVYEGVVNETHVTIIMDIDASQQVNLEFDRREEIWPILDKLRQFKNKIFFASLTEKAVRLFE